MKRSLQALLLMLILLPVLALAWLKFKKPATKENTVTMASSDSVPDKIVKATIAPVAAVAQVAQKISDGIDNAVANSGLKTVGDIVGGMFFGHENAPKVDVLGREISTLEQVSPDYVNPGPTAAQQYSAQLNEQYKQLSSPTAEDLRRLQMASKLFGR